MKKKKTKNTKHPKNKKTQLYKTYIEKATDV